MTVDTITLDGNASATSAPGIGGTAPATTRPADARGRPARRSRRGRTRRIVTQLILLVLGFFWIYPLLWALAGATRTNADFLNQGLGLNFGDQLIQNFAGAWNQANFSQYFLNTVVVTVTTVVFVVLFSAAAGYALARTDFPGRRLVMIVIAVTFFLPRGYTMIPIYDLITQLGLLNSLVSVIVVQVGSGMIFSTFLFMGFFRTLPHELEEAATIDGAGFNQTFARIVLPLAKPMIATIGLFTFISSWNDFLLPLIFTLGQPSLRTIPVGLYAFIGESSTNWSGLAAASVLSLIPIVIVFVVAQKYIISAIAGAVKG
jgi:ABC-type glycerol-3-phosphate transport system permease component